MSLFFANPLWWLGVLALAPLLAHLFARARPRLRPFPSVVLLRQAMRRVTRLRKPRDRWLLILRTLAMVALLLAFLQPWLRSRFGSSGKDAKTVVLVIDATASMGYVDGTRTRLAQAGSAAEDVLASLPASSRANIIWVRAHAASALPEPGPNFDFLRQGLRQAVAWPEPGDVQGALALALKQLNAAGGERELVVLSDFQKSGWQTVNWDLPGGIQVTRVPIGTDESPNVALGGLTVEPVRPVAGQAARLVCRVRNFSGEARRVTVFGEAGESRLSQAVELAPWSETLAVMPVTFPQEGLVPLKATLSEDRYPGDDVRHGLADVRGALQVGIIGAADDPTARTWERAAQALDGCAVRRLTWEQLADARAEVLFVAGWDGQGSEPLSAFLASGGSLVVQPAPGCKLEGNGLLPATSVLAEQNKPAPGWNLRIAAEDHPLFALFASGAYGDPAQGNFLSRVAPVSLPASVPAKPVLVFEDGVPALALLDLPLSSRVATVAWWNLDLGATDWVNRTAFVPFFGEFLRHLAGRVGRRSLNEFLPGDALRFEATATLDAKELRLLNERDEAVKLSIEAPQQVTTDEAIRPGSYRWMAPGGVISRAILNFPEDESDLRRLSGAELAASGGLVVSEGARERLAELREGKPLWSWFLAAAAGFFLLEGLLLRAFRSKAVAPVAPLVAKKEEVTSV